MSYSFALKTVDRITYENAVDHLNCELAKFYIERNQGVYELNAYLDSIAEFGCNFEHLMVFIKERQPQMDANGYLAEYIEALKPEYDEQIVNHALYNKAMDIFKEDLLNQYDGDLDYEERKKELKEYLEEELKIHEVGKTDGDVDNTQKPQKSFLDYFKMGWKSYLLIFIAILFFYGLYKLFSWLAKYSNTGTEKSSTSGMEQKAAKQKEHINESSEQRAKDKAAIESHSLPEVITPKSVEPPKKKVIAPVKKHKPKKIKKQPEQVQTPEPEEEEESFYMPYPSVDGSFYEFQRMEEYKHGVTAFKFQVKIAEYGLATFEVVSDLNIITDIFMDYERTIKAVCEIEGKPKDLDKVIIPGIKRIITVTPGTVQKRTQHQHWRLKQKAVIRFEYY